MTVFTCHAAEFLRSRGPAQIPLRACCAAAVIRSGTTHAPGTDLSSAPFVCLAAGLPIPPDGWRADGTTAGLPAPPDGWLAEGTTAGLAVPSDVRLADDPAIAGAEHIP
jgi:hypothetical protein